MHGVAYLRQDRTGKALSDFDNAIRLDPKVAVYSVRNRAALAHRDKKDYTLALADLNQCIGLAPNTPSFYEQRGLTYSLMEKTARASSIIMQQRNA